MPKSDQDARGTYECAMCHNTYESGWSDQEALAEKEQLWGDVPIEDCAVICNDCFQIITGRGH
jgi:hypothetical protein